MAPKGSPAEKFTKPTVRLSKLEVNKGELIGMIATGWPNREICDELHIHINALARFKQSHRAEIDAALERRARRLEDYSIASQVDRIADLQWWYDACRKEAEVYGHAVVNDKGVREYRAGMAQQARGFLRDAAEELGQLKDKPKGGDTNIAILIRQVEGYLGPIE